MSDRQPRREMVYFEKEGYHQPQAYPLDELNEVLYSMGVMLNAYQCTEEQLKEAVSKYETLRR